MEYRPVLNGMFEVNELGEVYRIKDGNREKATQSKGGNGGRHKIVTYSEKGKQKHMFVHRLVAMAFIPNPDNLPCVSHIDGDPSNNRAENLKWSMQSGAICESCGKQTNATDGICRYCKIKFEREIKQETKKSELQESLSEIQLDDLSPKTILYIQLRQDGRTLQEIADLCGVSRQCVDSSIKRAYIKSKAASRPSNAVRKRITQLRSKIARKQAQVDRINAGAQLVAEELSVLQKELEGLLAVNSATVDNQHSEKAGQTKPSQALGMDHGVMFETQ